VIIDLRLQIDGDLLAELLSRGKILSIAVEKGVESSALPEVKEELEVPVQNKPEPSSESEPEEVPEKKRYTRSETPIPSYSYPPEWDDALETLIKEGKPFKFSEIERVSGIKAKHSPYVTRFNHSLAHRKDITCKRQTDGWPRFNVYTPLAPQQATPVIIKTPEYSRAYKKNEAPPAYYTKYPKEWDTALELLIEDRKTFTFKDVKEISGVKSSYSYQQIAFNNMVKSRADLHVERTYGGVHGNIMIYTPVWWEDGVKCYAPPLPPPSKSFIKTPYPKPVRQAPVMPPESEEERNWAEWKEGKRD
jgi:hypothetical protein